MTGAPAHGNANALVPVPLTLARVNRETRDTVTLRLDAAPLAGGFRFAPGQFNMLYAFGVGEAAISVAGDPTATGEIVHTVRAVGAVTRAITSLRRGATLGLRGPFGRGWPVDQARGRDLLLVAGGLGIAPLRPVLHLAQHRRADFGRVAFLYGARTPEDLLYRRELERWRGRFDIDVGVTVDRAGADWRGRVGAVLALLPEVGVDPANTVAMVCGPEVMMRFTARELEQRGIAPERIHLSLERNMKCAVGSCGHCQLLPFFVCKDGPVLRYDRLAPFFGRREL